MSRLPKIATPKRQAYPSDLSDEEWAIISPLLPAPKGFGGVVQKRAILGNSRSKKWTNY